MENGRTLTFARHIEPSEERQYLRVSLVVPEDTDRLTIRYAYQRHAEESASGGRTLRREVSIIDLALEDAHGMLVGASGSDRQEVYVHENHATPGYRPQKLLPGTWHIVLGAYRVAPEGCTVQLTVTFTGKSEVLLRGDCHTHTVHSDGWYTVEQAIARARQDRLDYLFLTDHNSMTSNALITSDEHLTVLPGVEMTYYGGHYNLFGVDRPVRSYVANSREEVLAVFCEGLQKGALSSLNHPMDPGCPWTFGFGEDVPAHMVEIWNGPYSPYNQQAIDLWHAHLCQGRIWPAIGGSDCHHTELLRTYGTPTTFLYARSRSGSDILAAMQRGKAYIGMHPEAPGIQLRMGEAGMGEVHVGPAGPLDLRITGLGRQDEVLVLNQHGVVWNEKPGACLRFEAQVSAPGSTFLRAEVRRTLPGDIRTLAAISNPVYIRGQEK